MKALITGITGFKGSHLADLLLKEGVEVYGTIRWRARMDNIEHLKDSVKLLPADIRDGFSMRNVVQTVQPDWLFHLAAQSFVPESWKAPHETLYTNTIGTLNVLEAVRQVGCDTIIQVAGSSEEYGLVLPSETPIRETNPLRPMSPYGVSKVATDLLAQQYFRSYGLKAIITRSFNSEGPRRPEVFVTSFYAKRIAQIMKGKKEPILELGNMEAERDFTDVRDTVKAFLLLVQKGIPGEVYNLCSGISRKVQFIVDYLLAATGLQVEYTTDESLMRPSDVPRLQGDSSKFREATSWTPTIPFEQTLLDILDYWKERV